MKDASVLCLRPSEEVIAYFTNCKDIILKIYHQFEPLSDSFLIETKKLLIQYSPIVKWKDVCVIEQNCFRL